MGLPDGRRPIRWRRGPPFCHEVPDSMQTTGTWSSRDGPSHRQRRRTGVILLEPLKIFSIKDTCRRCMTRMVGFVLTH